MIERVWGGCFMEPGRSDGDSGTSPSSFFFRHAIRPSGDRPFGADTESEAVPAYPCMMAVGLRMLPIAWPVCGPRSRPFRSAVLVAQKQGGRTSPVVFKNIYLPCRLDFFLLSDYIRKRKAITFGFRVSVATDSM